MKFLRFLSWVLLCCGILRAQQSAPAPWVPEPEAMGTFSIVAWDSATGDLGVAVQSKFLGVGAVVPYARADVGAVATQAWANTEFGPRGLELLGRGESARQAVEELIQSDSNANRRQLAIVDAHGTAFAYTGSSCQQFAGHVTGNGYSVQGNILSREEVVKAMARTFELTSGDLASRMLAALEAGERAGGDKRGKQSAALLVVRDRGGYSGYNDRFVDIRVDDDSMPLTQLKRIYNVWEETFLFDARMRSIDEFNAKKNFAAARSEMERAVQAINAQLRSHPDDPDVLTRVAWILATHDLDRERALELAKRAAVLAPGRLQILDTVAECHYRLGHFDEAIAIETELVAKEPANDDFWKQLQKFREAKQKSGR